LYAKANATGQTVVFLIPPIEVTTYSEIAPAISNSGNILPALLTPALRDGKLEN
jgi:hypothetical protein